MLFRSVSETLQTRFWELVARRGGREPMAYIAGRKEFWSLPFAVGPGVLVPRPETETLVECALEFFSDNDAPMRILDCGTGSGCLLLAILHERPNARGIGIDRSADALAYARRNARDLKLDGRCELIQGSWSDAPRDRKSTRLNSSHT